MEQIGSLSDICAVLSRGLVGFVLGLLGGGGSILAVPLLVYVVRVRSSHIAIGTSALDVAVNVFTNLVAHSRAGHVKWPCAFTFAPARIAGAAGGAQLGQMVEDKRLLFLFGPVMMAVAAAMFRLAAAKGGPDARMNCEIAMRLGAIGLIVRFLSGFFGIGGGFLIVPAIMLGSGMATINAVGSSLVSVGALGLPTAVSYAFAGQVDWRLSGLFIVGGVGGGLAGVRLAKRLSGRRALLTRVFAGVVVAVAASVLWRSAPAFFG